MKQAPIESRTTNVDAVVVTYNSEEVIEGCLRNLEASPKVTVTVVDSLSADGTVAFVRSQFQGVNVVEQPANLGFGSGCNVGAQLGTAPYLLLLNPDARLGPEDLGALVSYLEEHPEVGAVGPSISDRFGVAAPTIQALPSLRGELARTFERLARPLGFTRDDELAGHLDSDVWSSGACLLIRREAWETTGPFDENFFLYFEETDWCLRAQRYGWTIRHAPAASCVHFGGESSGPSTKDAEKNTARHFSASRRRYFIKHHGRTQAALVSGLHGLRSWLDAFQRYSGSSQDQPNREVTA